MVVKLDNPENFYESLEYESVEEAVREILSRFSKNCATAQITVPEDKLKDFLSMVSKYSDKLTAKLTTGGWFLVQRVHSNL